jgi:hypothetical protein
MTDLNIIVLLQAFAAAGEMAQGLTLDGDRAADALEAWAEERKLPIERERMTRVDLEGTTIEWTLVRVTVRGSIWITASRNDERPVQAALERATKSITGFDYSDVNASLDAEVSAFPTDEDLP